MIGQTRSRDASSSRATWQNLSALSLTEWTWLNGNDLHRRVSFEPLIEYEEPNSNGHTQFYLYIRMFFGEVNHYWVFRVIELSRHLNPWISCFLPLLDQVMCPRSVWKWDFVERIGRNHLLNTKFCLRNCGMKSHWFGNQLDQFEREFGLQYMFFF